MAGGIGGAAPPRKLLGQALVWVLEGDLESAEATLRGLAQRDSDDALVYLALARVYRRRGEIGRAIQIHQNLLLRDHLTKDERHQALHGLAEDFRSGGFSRRAEAAFEEALASRARDPGTLSGLLRVLEDRGDLRRAADVAARLARVLGDRNPWMDAERWCAVAKRDREAGHAAEARKAVARALRLDRDHGNAWLLLGQLEADRGKTRKALAAWKRAAECDASSAASAYPKLEATYAALGKPRETEAVLRRAIERDPRDYNARLALCRVLVARGESQEALSLLEKDESGEGSPLPVALFRCRLLLAESSPELGTALEALFERLERDFSP